MENETIKVKCPECGKENTVVIIVKEKEVIREVIREPNYPQIEPNIFRWWVYPYPDGTASPILHDKVYVKSTDTYIDNGDYQTSFTCN